MRKVYFVDREMCGGDQLPPEFDLEEFCEVLQGRVPDLEVVPIHDPKQRAHNLDPTLVDAIVFREALTSHLRR
jgi:hypothetical protein